MRIVIAIVAALLSCYFSAGKQRALLIAINDYGPPEGKSVEGYRHEVRNLSGCLNDAKEMKRLIVSRFNFGEGDVKQLFDKEATRVGILNELQALLSASVKNDIVFIYYAGHGSQVRNSLTKEANGMDGTIVPADTWQKGVEDIRDKELSRLFNAFVDKGVTLTVIFDCCHSANMSRGAMSDQPVTRFSASPGYDSKDASDPPDPAVVPGSRFLMCSACQAYQTAAEARDDDRAPHGAFTLALLQAINKTSVNKSAADLFSEARAILKYEGKCQEPVLNAAGSRMGLTLFGAARGTLTDKVLVSVIGNKGSFVSLQAGIITGLNEGSELKNKDGGITLSVVEMRSADQCVAKVTKGNIRDVKGGDLFEITNWVSAGKPFLNVYVPASELSYAEVVKIEKECGKIRSSKDIKWISDPDLYDPGVSIYYRSGSWYASCAGSTAVVPVPVFNAAAIAAQFKGRAVFINVPPAKSMSDSFIAKLAGQRNVKLITADSIADAQYTLVGRVRNGHAEYALMKAGFAVQDSLDCMPVRTGYQQLSEASAPAIVDSLVEDALILGKIRAWVTLDNRNGNAGYPFMLRARNLTSGKWITPMDNVAMVGDKISLSIVYDSSDLSNEWDLRKRHVYVFMIDHFGATQLIFPPKEEGNDRNYLPLTDAGGTPVASDILESGNITSPTGTDSYYMLSTDEPIVSYYTVFDQKGVSRGSVTRGGSPLETLMTIGSSNSATRGAYPMNWSLQRIFIKTVYPRGN